MAGKRGSAAHVIFDGDAWAEDMARTSTDGRMIAERARRDYEQSGCPIDYLLACQEDAPDGSSLPGCVLR